MHKKAVLNHDLDVDLHATTTKSTLRVLIYNALHSSLLLCQSNIHSSAAVAPAGNRDNP